MMNKTTICNALGIVRWVGVGLGIFFAQLLGKNPATQLNILTAWAVISIAGLTGIESLFFFLGNIRKCSIADSFTGFFYHSLL